MSHISYGPWLKVLCAWWPWIFKTLCMSLFVVKLLSVTLLQYLVKNGSHSRLLLAPSSNLGNKRPTSERNHTDSALLKGTWYAVLNTHRILGFMYGIFTNILVGFECKICISKHHRSYGFYTWNPWNYIFYFWWHGSPHNKPRGQVSKVKNKRSCLVYTLENWTNWYLKSPSGRWHSIHVYMSKKTNDTNFNYFGQTCGSKL